MRSGAEFVVGLQSKYLAALEAILPDLPPSVVFRVIRDVPTEVLTPALADLHRDGRLCFLGALNESDLPAFYHGCDCILHLEISAGWANLVAEAMACGVPVVCSSAGTAAMTEGGTTALIVDPAEPAEIAAAIMSVQADPEAALCRAQRARAHILRFDWASYSARFLAAASDDGRKHYLDAPERGLHGKWPLISRLEGTEPLLALASGATILDIGCAEGVIAERLLTAGAQLVHGFDLDAGRINTARAICADGQVDFRADSVTPWPDFVQRHAGLLLAQYEIILYLAVHQHLDSNLRDAVLEGLLARAKRALAIRMPDALFETEQIDRRLTSAGFHVLLTSGSTVGGAGLLRIYVRKATS